MNQPAINAQNRESQRRSRARRKQLVDEQTRQLEEHKRRGVEASLEMQKAARAVFVENQRLRALLSLHGVSEGEISRHLSTPELTGGGNPYFCPGQDKHACDASCLPEHEEEHGQRPRGENYQHPEQIDYSRYEMAEETASPLVLADAGRAEATETSCDAAAAILVQLHEQTDPARVRVALGCTGPSSCSVKNTTIFRLMDEFS